MVIFGLACCYTAFDWAWSIYFRVEYALSTDVQVINDSSEDSIYILGANQVLWWVASMEICAWLGYTAHYLYRSQLRAARVSEILCFLFSRNASYWTLTE